MTAPVWRRAGEARTPLRDAAAAAVIALPIASLALAAMSWLRYGIDLPLWDDWRAYRNATMGSLDPSYLFAPENDTLYPVGKALDALAFRWLDGNTVAYQLLSMVTVLGLLLALQWRLLRSALGERLPAAAAFALTLPMLQPETYWGLQNLAFHQALPLVAILAALVIVLDARWRGGASPALLALLALVAGLSYISGAFAMLAVALVLLAAAPFIDPAQRPALRRGGLALAIPAAACALAQVWVIAVVQKGTHLPDVSLALPTEAGFWAFLLGKVARSLLLPVERPLWSLAVTAIVVGVAVAAAGTSARRLARGAPMALAQARTGLVYAALAAAITAYLLIVAAGRAHLHGPDVDSFAEYFALGFRRFHFFWVTLLWPWLAALLYTGLRRIDRGSARAAAVAAAAIACALLLQAGAFGHPAYYRHTMEARAAGIRCIQVEIQRGQGIDCPELDTVDLAAPFINGKAAGASFARALRAPQIPFGSTAAPPLFRLTPAATLAATLEDLELERHEPNSVALRAGRDAGIAFVTGEAATLSRCAILEAVVRQKVSAADSAQLFFRRPGQPAFAEAASQVAAITVVGSFVDVAFELVSAQGFADELRYDPVTRAQRFELQGLELRCRMQVPHAAGPRS